MKRSLLGLVTVALLVFTMAHGANVLAAPIPIKAGDQINISDYSGSIYDNAFIRGRGYGGPFSASSADGKWDDFITFCLEANESINFTDTFVVDGITDMAVNGGAGRGVFDGPNSDLLDPFTAWLYTRVMNRMYDNQLSDVQYAIWLAENEITLAELAGLSSSASAFYTTQHDLFEADNNWSGLGNVRVINLTDGTPTGYRQDLLVSVAPVPEPATMLLLGTGLIGIAGFGRKKLLKK